jgi:hypothetical protein
MPARSRLRTKPRVWRIDQQLGADADYLGVIVATDAEAAIEQACKKFGVAAPEQLIARELPRERVFPARKNGPATGGLDRP